MKNNKHIIFDFGGVLLDLRPESSMEALSKSCGIEMTLEDIDKSEYSFFHQHEKGEISNEAFLIKLEEKSKLPVSHEQLIADWNQMLLGWQDAKLQLLHDLQDKAYIYILSNTNDIHLQYVRKELSEQYGINDFDAFFHQSFYSHHIGMRKPDEDIFRYVASQLEVPSSECIFIDDNHANVLAAQRCGFMTKHHQRNAPLDYVYDWVE